MLANNVKFKSTSREQALREDTSHSEPVLPCCHTLRNSKLWHMLAFSGTSLFLPCASGGGVEASQACLLIPCAVPAFCKGGRKESKPGQNTSLQVGLASIPEVSPASLVQMSLVRHMSYYCENNALSPVAICICVVAFTFMSTSPPFCLST
jgi:hypothetical protein